MIVHFTSDSVEGRVPPGANRAGACAIVAAALVLVGVLPAAADVSGKVVAVHDGSTITVVTNSQQTRLRLAAIDAPDITQPHGKDSRQSLAGLCLGKTAALGDDRSDAGGRAHARVQCDGIDAGEQQVRRGLAWVDPQTAAKDSPLHALESGAKAARRGLWADPAPVPPWIWRRKMCCSVSVQ